MYLKCLCITGVELVRISQVLCWIHAYDIMFHLLFISSADCLNGFCMYLAGILCLS